MPFRFWTILLLNLSLASAQSVEQTIAHCEQVAKQNADQALAVLDSLKAASPLSAMDEISWYCTKGRILMDATRYSEAMEVLEEGFRLAEVAESDSAKGMLSLRLGTLNLRLNRMDKGIEQLLYADSVGKALQLALMEYSADVNLGGIYTQLQNSEKAEFFLLKSLALMKQNEDAPPAYILHAQRILATLYAESGQQQKADELFQSIVQEARNSGDDKTLAGILLYYSPLLIQNGEPERALALVEEAKDLIGEGADLAHENVSVYDAYAEALFATGRLKDAFAALRNSKNYEKEVFSAQMKDAISEVEVKYETERIKRQNKLAEERAKTAELMVAVQQAKNNQLLTGLILSLGLLLLTILVFRFRQQRLRADQESVLQRERIVAVIDGEERERERLAMELHDGICQTLAALKMNLQAAQFNDPASLKLLDHTLVEIRRISHDLLPLELAEGGLELALKDLVDQLNRHGVTELKLDYRRREKELPKETEKNLFRIAQEMIHNSLKHANATRIQLSIYGDDTGLDLAFSDDGKGFSHEKLKTAKGIGWKNIMARLEILKGKMKFETPAKGTQILLSIPLN